MVANVSILEGEVIVVLAGRVFEFRFFSLREILVIAVIRGRSFLVVLIGFLLAGIGGRFILRRGRRGFERY